MKDGLDILISQLQDQKGKAFWQQLEAITRRREFTLIEKGIYSALGPGNPDMDHLLDAARKANYYGYTVYILPNPRGSKSADLIFEQKGIFRLYELKTITGKNSVGNRLKEAVFQSGRVILNMTVQYNPRKLAKEIKDFFTLSREIVEVLVLFRGKRISINRQAALNHTFNADFRKALTK
jgi:hypothetical protein